MMVNLSLSLSLTSFCSSNKVGVKKNLDYLRDSSMLQLMRKKNGIGKQGKKKDFGDFEII